MSLSMLQHLQFNTKLAVLVSCAEPLVKMLVIWIAFLETIQCGSNCRKYGGVELGFQFIVVVGHGFRLQAGQTILQVTEP